MSVGVSADVVIAGRGPSAFAAALALRERGLEVVVIGPADEDHRGHRGETVPATSLVALSRLFREDPFTSAGHLPCYAHISVWGSDTVNARSSLMSAHGPAVILDRPSILKALDAQFRSAGGRFINTTNWRAGRDGAAFRIEIKGNAGESSLSCQALVDATGRRALAARGLGAARQVWSRQTAFSTSYSSPPGDLDLATTVVEALDNGWLYGAPDGSGRAVVWWVTDPDLAGVSRARIQDQVLCQVERSVFVARWIREHNLEPNGCWAARDASVGGLNHVAGAGWVAVGDAALALDPLSSSGITAALLSGHHGARALSAWIDGQDAELVSYATITKSVRDHHLEQRRRFYQVERRWPSAPFWIRRFGFSSPRDGRVSAGRAHAEAFGDRATRGNWAASLDRAHSVHR